MYLPTELVDNIIDEVFTSTEAVDGPTPSALALVSHTFRERTNFHRFSKISFMDRIEPLLSVHELLALLTANVWAPHVDVARHVREFSLALGAVVEVTVMDDRYGPSQHKELGPHPALTDGAHPQIPNIEIFRLNDLPPTLLAASRIRKLTLRKARFKLPLTSDHPMPGSMIQLQELGIDGVSEFTQGFEQLAPTLGFPAVRHLRYYIDTHDTFWISLHPWKHLGALETLTLDIIAKPLRFDCIQNIIPCAGHLQHLKKLIIAVDASLGNRVGRLSGLTADFVMVTLFTGILPHLPLTNDLELSFRSEDLPQISRNSIAAIFSHFNFTHTDQVIGCLLTVYNKLTFTSTRPTITLAFHAYIDSAWEDFDVQELCEAGYLFLQQSFPLTNSGLGRKIFKNKFSKISPNDGKHHYDITVSLVYSG